MTLKTVLHATLAASAILTVTAAPGYAQIRDITAQPLPPAPATTQTEAQIEAQIQGQFSKPADIRAIPPGGAIQNAWDTAPANAGILDIVDPRNVTPRLVIREGAVTTIILPEGEAILEPILGDGQNFRITYGEDKRVLHVSVTAAGFDTNLNITSDSGAVYSFYLRGETWRSGNIPATKVRLGARNTTSLPNRLKEAPQIAGSSGPRGIETADQKQALAAHTSPATAPEWTREHDFDPSKTRYDLEFSGDETLAPETAFRDDKFTWLYFGDDSDAQTWPAVWAVIDDIDRPVRVRRSPDGRFLVVEHSGPITLRNGERVLCIRPRA